MSDSVEAAQEKAPSSAIEHDTKGLLRKVYSDLAVFTAAFTAPGVVGYLASGSLKSFIVPALLVGWSVLAAVVRRNQILKGDI